MKQRSSIPSDKFSQHSGNCRALCHVRYPQGKSNFLKFGGFQVLLEAPGRLLIEFPTHQGAQTPFCPIFGTARGLYACCHSRYGNDSKRLVCRHPRPQHSGRDARWPSHAEHSKRAALRRPSFDFFDCLAANPHSREMLQPFAQDAQQAALRQSARLGKARCTKRQAG